VFGNEIMEDIDKEDYKCKISSIKEKVEDIIDEMEWTKDISIYSETDRFGRKNWVGKLMTVKGQMKTVQEILDTIE